jgi:hypothetical protein
MLEEDVVDQLDTSIAAKEEGAEAEARDWLLTSSGTLLTSAVEANKNLKPGKRQSLEACLEAPDFIDLGKPFPQLRRGRLGLGVDRNEVTKLVSTAIKVPIRTDRMLLPSWRRT